ncbi:MAG: DUF4363 family protein [Clostridia bacterium]|nr:DUF4363 family protein [Clostridia bacterium]
MKSFVVSLIFLGITAITVAVNCVYVTGVLGKMDEALSALPEISDTAEIPREVSDRVHGLFDFWQRHRRFLALTINQAELRDCTAALGNLAVFCDSRTPADYDAALSESRLRISTLLSRESFTLENII